jgi:hypothetical protein
MSLGDYLLGAAGLITIGVALGWGAYLVRARILPAWVGAPARHAEAVIAVCALFVLAELLGVLGLLEGAALVAGAVLLAGLARIFLPGPAGAPAQASPRRVPAAPRVMTLVAIGVALIVATHWAVEAQRTMDFGLYNGDDLQTHLPFAARFAQDGSITALNFSSPSYLVWLYPANSELFHAAGMTLFQSDLSAPLLNLAWMALTLLAAWSLGSRFGAAPQAMLAAALVLDLPVLVGTQAGTTKNDVLVLAALASAAALLVNGAADAPSAPDAARRSEREPERSSPLPDRPIEPAVLALAGLVTGLAAGTKFSAVPVAAVLTIGLVWIAAPRDRLRALGLFVVPMLATGGIWYLRNLIDAGNPLPWIDEIGPLTLPGLHQSLEPAPPLLSIASRLTDGQAWSDSFSPGLSQELGPLWPVLLALAGGGLVAGLLMRRSGVVMTLAASGTAALILYLVLPLPLEGDGGALVGFAYTLRHLTPALLIGAMLGACLIARTGEWAAWAVFAGLALMTLGFTRRGLDFWGSSHLLTGALLAAIALIAIPVGVAMLAPSGPRGRLAAVAIAVTAAAIVVGAGWPRADDYAEARYRALPPAGGELQVDGNAFALLPAFRWAQDQHDIRIGTSATLQYGLYDDRLSNQVSYVGVTDPDASFHEPLTCRAWRAAVNRGDYEYLVTAPRYGGRRAPQTGWTRDPGVSEVVLHDGPVTIFRLAGPLDPAGCGQSAAAGKPARSRE